MEERRGAVRFPVTVLVEFLDPNTAKPERSFTDDVSTSGIRFPTAARLQISQELALTLELPSEGSEGSAFRATGEVIWIREIARLGATQYEVGVRFRWIEDPDLQRLNQFLHVHVRPPQP